MYRKILPLGIVLLVLSPAAAWAAELVLSAGGKSEYQIVLPDKTSDPVIDRSIAEAAEVMREMFLANGSTVPVVKESQAVRQKPGVFVGETAAAKAAGIETSQLPAWTYVWKTAGKNVLIAGRDYLTPKRQPRGTQSCSLGTVKGMADFMRRFGSTRFLAPGGLTGIEFLPTSPIAVPDDLSLRKEPMLAFNGEERPVTDAARIALNFLNDVASEYFAHTHEIAVPADKYAEKHPEYFALVQGKRIREHEHPWQKGVMVKEPHLCYSNKDVQELIYQDMLRSFDAGYPAYLSLQADGFQPCTCQECKGLFQTADWGEKLWLLNKRWAERLLKDRPGKVLVVTAYTVTGKPPAAFKEFPPNMAVSLGGYPKAFETWEGWKVPAGFWSYLHAWGGYHLCGYLPTRTPLYAEKVARMYDRQNVKGVGLDSPPAIMWGLEGPTVYVYSRMIDDVKGNTALRLVDEYLQAAYGRAAPAMTRFFDELHHTLATYAEVFGVDNGTFQTYTRADGRTVRYLTWQTKLRLIGFLYPPETLTLLESHLAQAEKVTELSKKQRLRLALVRREFDYLKSTASVVHLYNAYQTRPGKGTLDQLLTEMESREKMILSWYDTKRAARPGVYLQKPIAPDWPMYIGGQGYYNTHLLANGGSYLSQPVPPFTWNLAEVRKSPLVGDRKITAKKTPAPLSLDSAWWSDVPAEPLGPMSLGTAVPQQPSEVKVAYDGTAIYVRLTGKLPRGWTPTSSLRRDHHEIVSSESFSVFLAPDNHSARYYRLAGGTSDTNRYDARRGFIEDSIDPRFNQDDPTWNPDWRYQCAVAPDAGSWSALMVVPFQSLGVAPPASGAEWKANFCRVHQLRRGAPREVSLWSSNPGTTSIDDTAAMGTLLFQ